MVSENSRPFQPIANPYIVGNPIEDRNMFFGREDDFTYIRTKVTGGKKGGLLVLCGTRRSGKTSILFQIRGGRLGKDFVPVLIDMQSMTVQDDVEFLEKLAQELVVVLDEPTLSVQKGFLRQDNPFSAFQDFIDTLNEKLGGKNLVLMFDEYELFETHIAKERFSTDILNLMANWMERVQGFFIIFTGSDKLETRNSRYWGAFLGKALHRRISFLSHSDTLRLIQDPVAGTVQYKEAVPDEIFTLTAGQPFYTQVLCQSLIDHLNESEKYWVGSPDVDQAVGEIIENPLPQMIFTWSSLTDIEKLSLSIFAELEKGESQWRRSEDILAFLDEEDVGYQLESNKLNESLERLFQHDLLEKSPDGGAFKFKMDLWRRWVARMHSLWQVINEIGGQDRELGEGIVRIDRKPRRKLLLAILAPLVILGGAWFAFRGALDPTPPIVPQTQPVVVLPESTLLSVRTEPVGAKVFFDERLLGPAPIDRKRVVVKEALLRVELEGYRDFSQVFALAESTVLDTAITLIPRTGDVRIESEPPGANISLGGRQTGQATPHTFTGLPTRERLNISLVLPGYLPKDFSGFEIREDTTLTLRHSFARITHPLTIVSEPAGATVFLDRENLGRTPLGFSALSEGTHQLELRKGGFQTATRTIEVSENNPTIQVDLIPLPNGTLVFQIEPYAELLINGELVKDVATYFTLERPPGTYQCEFRHPAYETARQTVELPPGEEILVQQKFSN